MKAAKALLLAGTLAAWGGGTAWASEYEPEDGTEGHVPAHTYEMQVLGPGERVDPAIMRTDLEYTGMMTRHHEGAVAMSKDYLADPRGTNPIVRELAHAIIANQRFEVAMLEQIRKSVERPPQTVLDLGFARIVGRATGIDGHEHLWQFVRLPAPSLLDFALAPGLEPSEFDVAFAKGMILHHQAALDMAREYNADPKAQNRVLALMNLDIIVDQTYEIGLLQRLMDRFPGDPRAVEPLPSQGMPMDHGQGGMGGNASPGAAGGMDHMHGQESE